MTEEVRRKVEAMQDDMREKAKKHVLTEEEKKNLAEARKMAEHIAEMHHDKTRPVYIRDEFVQKADELILLTWLISSEKMIVDIYEKQEGWTERQKMDMVAHDFANMGFSLVKALAEERTKNK